MTLQKKGARVLVCAVVAAAVTAIVLYRVRRKARRTSDEQRDHEEEGKGEGAPREEAAPLSPRLLSKHSTVLVLQTILQELGERLHPQGKLNQFREQLYSSRGAQEGTEKEGGCRGGGGGGGGGANLTARELSVLLREHVGECVMNVEERACESVGTDVQQFKRASEHYKGDAEVKEWTKQLSKIIKSAMQAPPRQGGIPLDELLTIMSDNYESLNGLMDQCAVEATVGESSSDTPQALVRRQVKLYESMETEVANAAYARHNATREQVEAAVRAHSADKDLHVHLAELRKAQKARFRKHGIKLNV